MGNSKETKSEKERSNITINILSNIKILSNIRIIVSLSYRKLSFVFNRNELQDHKTIPIIENKKDKKSFPAKVGEFYYHHLVDTAILLLALAAIKWIYETFPIVQSLIHT